MLAATLGRLRSTRWQSWFAALTLAFLIPRIAFLSADPPVALSGTVERAQDFWLEPPAKAHEARNKALFGAWRTNDADQYQFWRFQSPMWVYPLAGVFTTFGVSYVSLRSFSISIALFGFLIALALARERYRDGAFLVLGLGLALNFHAILFDRSGLIEVMTSSAVAATMLCLYFGNRHPLWLTGSQLWFVIAFFAKQGAIYAFPALVIFNVLSFLELRRKNEHSRILWLPVGTAALIGVCAVAYILHPEYQRTLYWNVGHMMFAGEQRGSFINQVASVWARLGSVGKYHSHLILTFPVFAVLAAGAVGRTLLRGMAGHGWPRWDALVAVWLASAWVALLVIRQDDVRFAAILVLPVFLLAGQAVADTFEWGESQPRTRSIAGAMVVIVLLSLLRQCGSYVNWMRQRQYQLIEAADTIREKLGDQPAVIVGRFSAPMILQTPYEHYYVKWFFNTDVETMAQFGTTHALWRTRKEETEIHLAKFGQKALRRKRLALLPFRRDKIRLVRFRKPLLKPGPDAPASGKPPPKTANKPN